MVRWWVRVQQAWSRAFAVAEGEPLSAAQLHLLDEIAEAIARRGLRDPTRLVLASCEPLGFVGGQAATALFPLLEPFVDAARCDQLREVLARRDGLSAFLAALDAAEAR